MSMADWGISLLANITAQTDNICIWQLIFGNHSGSFLAIESSYLKPGVTQYFILSYALHYRKIFIVQVILNTNNTIS